MLPTNFSNAILDLIGKLNRKYSDICKIIELYGSFKTGYIGSGRPRYYLPKVTKQQFKIHIMNMKEKDKDIKFNYLLNASCINGYEASVKGRKNILNFVEFLLECGVTKLTIAVPYLIKIIKEKFPEIKINISSFAYVESLFAVKFYEKLGINSICIGANILKNLSLLKKLKKRTSTELVVMLNLGCIKNCPLRYYHANISSHSSQINSYIPKHLLNYIHYTCKINKKTMPNAEFLYIPPSKIIDYINIGIKFFKIVGRGNPIEKVINLTEEYMNNYANIIQKEKKSV